MVGWGREGEKINPQLRIEDGYIKKKRDIRENLQMDGEIGR